MMIFKRITAAVVALAAIFAFVSCGTDLSSTAEESRTVMTVDGYEVPYEMYRYAVKMHLRDEVWAIMVANGDTGEAKSVGDVTEENIKTVVDSLGEEKAALEKSVEEHSMETLVNIYSLFAAAKEEGVDPFGEMINELTDMEMEKLRATYEDDEEYLETIKLFYMNNSVYSVLTRYEIVFNELYEQYVKSGVIDTSDEAVIEYMNSDKAVRAKQIFISFERHSEEEALSVANDVMKKVSAIVSEDGIADEAKFDALVDQHGEDLFSFKNRDGYYICRGYSDEAFEEAAFSLEIGHVSEVVRTSSGYSIIMRAEKESSYIEEHIDAVRETCVGGIYRSILDEYSANAEAKTNDEFEKIDIFTIK